MRNILFRYPKQDGRAIVPDLAGPVAVMDNDNTVISVVNVSVLLEKEQHKCVHFLEPEVGV